MIEIWLRIREPLNTFWRRFRNWMLAFFAAGVAIGDYTGVVLEILHAIGEFGNALFLAEAQIPAWMINYAKYMRAIGLFGAFFAQLTVKSTEILKEKKRRREYERQKIITKSNGNR